MRLLKSGSPPGIGIGIGVGIGVGVVVRVGVSVGVMPPEAPLFIWFPPPFSLLPFPRRVSHRSVDDTVITFDSKLRRSALHNGFPLSSSFFFFFFFFFFFSSFFLSFVFFFFWIPAKFESNFLLLPSPPASLYAISTLPLRFYFSREKKRKEKKKVPRFCFSLKRVLYSFHSRNRIYDSRFSRLFFQKDSFSYQKWTFFERRSLKIRERERKQFDILAH